MTVQQPHGTLVSFGSSNSPAVDGDRLVFSGTGSLSGDPDNSPPRLTVQAVEQVAYRTGQTFGTSLAGPSRRPLDKTQIQYDYYLATTPGLAEADIWPDMQARIDAEWAWFFGTYDYANPDGSKTYSGASGMAGDLVVEDASGVARVCAADWDEWTLQLVPGEPSQNMQGLTFTRLSDWS